MISIIVGLLKLVTAILLLPFLYTGLLIIYILNEPVRLIVRIILYFRHGDSLFLMDDGIDSYISVPIEGQTRICCMVLTVPQGILTPENVAQYYEERIQSYLDKKTGRRIYSKLEFIITSAYGYSCWRRDLNFNVRNQIDQLSTDTIYSREMLGDVLSENHKIELDESKPQWRFLIVPKFDDGSGTLKSIIFHNKHHSYFDGVGCTQSMNVLSPGSKLIIDPMNFKVPTLPNIIAHLRAIVYLPVPKLTNFLERYGLIQMWVPNPVKILPRRKFYVFSKKPVDFAELKKIKTWASSVENGASVSISSVLNTAVWRALKSTFPPERLVKELTFMEVTAILPYPDESLVNRMTFFQFSLPSKSKGGKVIPTEGSRLLQDLKKANQEAKKAMASPEILGFFYMAKFLGKLPRFVVPFFLKGATGSVIVSPLPTTKHKCSIMSSTCNVPVESIEGITPLLTDTGLSICGLTYGGEIRFNGVADSNWMSKNELDMLVQQVAKELSKMVEIVDSSHKEGEVVDLHKLANVFL